VEELFDRLREFSRKNPELAGRLFKAVQGGYKRGRRKVYDSMRVRGSYSLPPRFRPYFICKEYAFSKGWISKPSNSEFAAFCIRTVIQNLLRRRREEEEEIARKGGEESGEEFRSRTRFSVPNQISVLNFGPKSTQRFQDRKGCFRTVKSKQMFVVVQVAYFRSQKQVVRVAGSLR